MHRFFISSGCISKDNAVISIRKDIHYFTDVLRFKIGEEVIIFDERGREYTCIVEGISKKVSLKIKEKIEKSGERKRVSLAIACAIPKKAGMDDIVDKLTQLGVDKIIPLNTERVIVKLDKHKEGLRLKRWQTIALNAAQQSQRNSIPVIQPVRNMREILSECEGYDLKIIPTLAGERKTLKEVLIHFKPKAVIALIGPEGDFSDGEVELAKNKGFIPVTLGDSVLRVETAAVAVASFISLCV
jgi:16S rRNA (uracil1498-N3)-methyltransferase